MSETSTRQGDPAREFEQHRSHLFGVAYRMLGSVTEAEDAVQEAYLRWHQAARAEVRTPRAWLTTTVTRLCIDYLRAARTRRERYVGPWLPEPLLTDDPAGTLGAPDAEARVELAEGLSMAASARDRPPPRRLNQTT